MDLSDKVVNPLFLLWEYVMKDINKIEVLNNLKKAVDDATKLYKFIATNCFDEDWLSYFNSKKLEFYVVDVIVALEKAIASVVNKFNEENN